MNTTDLVHRDATTWEIPQTGEMRVPVMLYAGESLIRDMDDKVREQACNVAMLPGIVAAVHVMPDAHWGYVRLSITYQSGMADDQGWCEV